MTKLVFAARFSVDVWGRLCTHDEFNRLLDVGDFDGAEAFARQVLSWSPEEAEKHRRLAFATRALEDATELWCRGNPRPPGEGPDTIDWENRLEQFRLNFLETYDDSLN